MIGPIDQPWGKLRRDERGEIAEWHPVVDHCADVAACAEALLRAGVLRERLARLAGLPALTEGMVQRLCVLAALHDLGKFNHRFQRRAGNPQLVGGHVSEALGLLKLDTLQAVPRNEVIEALRLRELAEWERGGGAQLQLLKAAVSHHGKPQEPSSSLETMEGWRAATGYRPLVALGQLLERTRQWFPEAWSCGDDGQLPAATPDDHAEFGHAFAGLVMLADWLGSDTAAFPYSERADGERIAFSRKAAAKLVRSAGIDLQGLPAVARIDDPERFTALFGYAPRPMQLTLASGPAHPSGSVTLLESETGSGKTEAAFARFISLRADGLVDGLYFALPTRTAAIQLHARIRDAAHRAFGDAAPGVVLAVPGYLRVDDTDGVRALATHEVLWPDDPLEARRFRGWASEHPKRYLAGGIVVGAIDQVLLSSLEVSHAWMRGTALLRHLLVVDEVHASDAYMSRILEAVLQRHVGAGGHALLLSATLGSSARAGLLREGRRPESLEIESGRAYPLITTRDHVLTRLETGRVEGGDKDVCVEFWPLIDQPDALAGKVATLPDNARIAVLRNTVADCIATQEALERSLPAERLFRVNGLPAPHHARFARADRIALDHAVERDFGKLRDTGARVICATQTIQQSLDLDFDLLVTDLCPIDVLLQRVGRLHRHRRAERPSGAQRPTVIVLVPEDRDLSVMIRSSGEVAGRHGFGSVYSDLRVLDATWALLEAHRSSLRIPEMNRALVEGATHPDCLRRLSERSEAWMKHRSAVEGTAMAQRGGASIVSLDPAKEAYAEMRLRGLDERISTRLGAGDRRLLFDGAHEAVFGGTFNELTLPAHMAGQVSVDEGVQDVRRLAASLSFVYGHQTYRYDRLGLRRTAEPLGDA